MTRSLQSAKGRSAPEDRQLDVHAGVAGADHDAVVVIQQQKAVQPIRARLHGEEDAEQSRAMPDRGLRQ